MLKRACRKAAHVRATESSASAKPKCKPTLNLRASPLMKWAAKRVGKGAESSLFQEVAQACVDEVQAATGHGGFDMVTESALAA